jgi:hypothetical protein
LYNVDWGNIIPDEKGMWSNTMPIGNGNLAANVWADNSTGSVLLLVSKADAWNEAAELIKVSILNVTFSPNPFASSQTFEQELMLPSATVRFNLGGKVNVNVWADAEVNTIVVKSDADDAFDITAATTIVRTAGAAFKPSFDCSTYSLNNDTVASLGDEVIFYHRNADFKEKSYFAQTLQGENIYSEEMAKTVPDPLTNLTIGGAVFGVNLKRVSPLVLQSAQSAKSFTVGYTALTMQDKSTDSAQWLRQIQAQAAAGIPDPGASHSAWWSSFWTRSYIRLGSAAARARGCPKHPPPAAWTCSVFGCTCQGMADYYGVVAGVGFGCAPLAAQSWWTNTKRCNAKTNTTTHPGCGGNAYCTGEFIVSRQYTLQRYLTAIQARSPFPIKFNGLLFTALKPPQVDFRQWGGHNWWQNWRLPYYSSEHCRCFALSLRRSIALHHSLTLRHSLAPHLSLTLISHRPSLALCSACCWRPRSS